MEKLKEIIEQNRDKEKPTYEVKTIGYEDRLSPEEERAIRPQSPENVPGTEIKREEQII